MASFSAAMVSSSLLPCEVMKSMLMSTLFFFAHSWQIASIVLFAPGTQ